MPAPTPQFIAEAFAIDADPSRRNDIPTTTVDEQRASLELGFPPKTMTPVVAGGLPMLGPDMNGILYMLSSHTVYAQSGQPYPFSTDVATAIGGYAVGTILGSTDGQSIWYNLTAANTTDPNSGASVGWVPLFSYGLSNISSLSGGSRTLTPQESAKTIIVLSGALVGNQQIVMPATIQSWLIVNATTGSFIVTVKTASDAGVTIPAGGYASPTGVYGNGTGINLTYSPAALPIDVNPTADTIPLRDNLGYLYAASPGAADDTTRVATTAMVQDVGSAVYAQALTDAKAADLAGTAQAYTGVSRALGVTYTNSTGRPIMVVAVIACPASPIARFVVYVNGFAITANIGNGASGSIDIPITFPVKAGSTYGIFVATGSPSLSSWVEMR